MARPSYQSVRRIVQGLDHGLLALAHHGPDVYRDYFELVLRRESALSTLGMIPPAEFEQANYAALTPQSSTV